MPACGDRCPDRTIGWHRTRLRRTFPASLIATGKRLSPESMVSRCVHSRGSPTTKLGNPQTPRRARGSSHRHRHRRQSRWLCPAVSPDRVQQAVNSNAAPAAAARRHPTVVAIRPRVLPSTAFCRSVERVLDDAAVTASFAASRSGVLGRRSRMGDLAGERLEERDPNWGGDQKSNGDCRLRLTRFGCDVGLREHVGDETRSRCRPADDHAPREGSE
jgi:hypothetical protein